MKGGCRVTYYCSSPGCYADGEAHGVSVEHAEMLLRQQGWSPWTMKRAEAEGHGDDASWNYRVNEFLCPTCFEAWKKEHS